MMKTETMEEFGQHPGVFLGFESQTEPQETGCTLDDESEDDGCDQETFRVEVGKDIPDTSERIGQRRSPFLQV